MTLPVWTLFHMLGGTNHGSAMTPDHGEQRIR